jgi:hypothetical protein
VRLLTTELKKSWQLGVCVTYGTRYLPNWKVATYYLPNWKVVATGKLGCVTYFPNWKVADKKDMAKNHQDCTIHVIIKSHAQTVPSLLSRGTIAICLLKDHENFTRFTSFFLANR